MSSRRVLPLDLRCVNVFEASLTSREFCNRYKDRWEYGAVIEGGERECVKQARTAFGLAEADMVMGQQKVLLSQFAFQKFEDQLLSGGVEEQKPNRTRMVETKAGLDPRAGMGDPYGPYPGSTEGDYGDVGAFGASYQYLPLMANASLFQRAELYDDELDERKSLRSDDYDEWSNYTSQQVEASNYGSERNMFQGGDGNGTHCALLEKEALAGEIQEGETTEMLKESSARCRWVALYWIRTWWCPSFCCGVSDG